MQLSAIAWNWYLHPGVGPPSGEGPLQLMGRVSVQARRAPSSSPFRLSFEQICQRLEVLPRMFLEPDGSFVWRFERGQWDGQINDGPSGCMEIQIKGRPTPAAWEALLAAVGWPEQQLTVQLVQQGLFLTPEDFCRLWRARDDDAS